MTEKKQFVIKMKGELISATEDVYLAYYRGARHDRYLAEKDKRHNVVHFNAWDTDELLGEEMLPDLEAELTEDKVIRKFLLERLRECLKSLTDGERDLFDALFYRGISETAYSSEIGISQQLISYRKKLVLKKLKKLLEK